MILLREKVPTPPKSAANAVPDKKAAPAPAKRGIEIIDDTKPAQPKEQPLRPLPVVPSQNSDTPTDDKGGVVYSGNTPRGISPKAQTPKYGIVFGERPADNAVAPANDTQPETNTNNTHKVLEFDE
jgi:hypothetical protein